MRGAIAFFLLVALGGVGAARASEYVRDEVHVNVRTGPGNDYRSLKLVSSGERLVRIGEEDDWVQVRLDDGTTGWLPSRFVGPEPPARTVLPRVEARLGAADTQIKDLMEKLGAQSKALQELEGLRERNTHLEKENRNLGWSDTWKKWLTGAAIAGFFLIVGGLWPERAPRTRKIKL